MIVIIILSMTFDVKSTSANIESRAVVRPVAPAVPHAPLDTTLVNETYSSWTMGGGDLYWQLACQKPPQIPSGGNLPATTGFLKRMPAELTPNGPGDVLTLATVDPSSCNNLAAGLNFMAADDSGLYYYNQAMTRIELRTPGLPYTPSVIYNATAQSAPKVGLALSTDMIYWIGQDNQIYYVSKFGGNATPVGTTAANPTSLVVHTFAGSGEWVFWLDSTGLWEMLNSLSGGTQKRLLSGRPGSGLLYLNGAPPNSGLSLAWAAGSQVVSVSCAPLFCITITLYTAPTSDSQIGQLGVVGSNLFWVESYQPICSPVPCLNRVARLRRMPVGGGTAVTLADNLPYQPRFLSLYTDNANVYYGDSPIINQIPADAQALVHDLAVTNWEVTQGVQSLNNDVPLVANKPTYVRVYGQQWSGTPANWVEAVLIGTQNGKALPGSPLHPLNGVQSFPRFLIPDRSNLNDGWLFQLPDSWTNAGLTTLTVQVDPRGIYNDPNPANNTLVGTFPFTAKETTCAVFISVWTVAGESSVHDPYFWNMIDLFKRLYPLSDLGVYSQDQHVNDVDTCWAGPFPYPCDQPLAIPQEDGDIMDALESREDNSVNPPGCAWTHYVGMVNPDTPTASPKGTEYGRGLLSTGGTDIYSDLWIKLPTHDPSKDLQPPPGPFWPLEGRVLAHEMGHNYTRRHVNCPNGVPEDIDPNYPYDPCTLDDRSTLGASTHFGFDTATLTPISPDSVGDLMSYKNPGWTSDYTWKGLFNIIPNKALAPNNVIPPSATVPNLAAAAAVVRVSGWLTPSMNQGILDYAWVYPTGALGPGLLQKWQTLAAPNLSSLAEPFQPSVNPPPHTYSLRVMDAANNVLANPVIYLALIDSHDNSPQTATFRATFPAPTGTVARLDLMQDSTVLATLQPGSNAPTVTVLKPAGGETFDNQMTIVWRASDADPNDRLLYTVQYSPDAGHTWRAVATNFPGPTGSDRITLTLNSLLGLPGSGAEQGLIRVAASDGYNTTLAQSGPFTVADHPPEPYIVSPAPNQLAPAGEPIVLSGGATDPEDGALPGSTLRWQVDGLNIGTGQQQFVAGLAPGSHSVMLTAHDSANQQQSATTTVNVDLLYIPFIANAPTLDGVCDDAAYANAKNLQLSPYSDNSQGVVHLIRTTTDLWVCFSNLQRPSGVGGDKVNVNVDVKDTASTSIQPGDLYFSMAEDGTPSTNAVPGMTAYISGNQTWNAELRLPASSLGGWNHLVGLDFSQSWGGAYQYHWPYRASSYVPNTWARTLLGNWPYHLHLPLITRQP